MRYAVFAGIHSNLEALEAVLAASKAESIDSCFCAGDIIGYAKEAISWTARNLNNVSLSFLKSLKLIRKNKDLALLHATLSEAQNFGYMRSLATAEKIFLLMKTIICFFLAYTYSRGIYRRQGKGVL